MKRKILSLLTTLILILSLCVPAFAAVSDTGFSDVAADAWYADASMYVRENGIMNGTSSTTFSPNATMTRAMLAAVLYRAAGSPAVSGRADFRDVAANAYYADAAAWASANGIVTGYGNGLFGSNDPVTREQIAAILWRYQGSPAPAGTAQRFADQSAISNYAVSAVAWARENGIINGMESNRFAPKNNAIRAQVATILRNFLTMAPAVPQPDPSTGSKVLVAYYSGSGNTARVAETLADELDADLFEITPVTPYTAADLDWTQSSSRVNREHENESLRDVALTQATPASWGEYDTVLIGYPIWWGIAAWPVNNFVKDNDFTGKTVIPFATSISSGMGQSGDLLETMANGGDWQEGRRFSSGEAENTVRDWAAELEL